MSTLSEIGDFLEAAGVAVSAVDLFLGSRPESPDTCLTVYEYGGNEPEYVQNSFAPIAERPQIQVVARSRDYEQAKALAWSAWMALSPVTNTYLSGVYYRSIRPNGSPGLMGRDANDRVLVSFNATVDKEVPLAIVS